MDEKIIEYERRAQEEYAERAKKANAKQLRVLNHYIQMSEEIVRREEGK